MRSATAEIPTEGLDPFQNSIFARKKGKERKEKENIGKEIFMKQTRNSYLTCLREGEVKNHKNQLKVLKYYLQLIYIMSSRVETVGAGRGPRG